MKKLFLITMAIAACLNPSVVQSETAQARLYCESLRVFRGYDEFDLSTMDFTTAEFDINRELAPLSGSVHWSYFVYAEFGFPAGEGLINVSRPPFTDANGNGQEDFFEASEFSSGVSSGALQFFDEPFARPITASWSRGVGSLRGTVYLDVGGLGEYECDFDIIEFKGPFSYSPGQTNANGSMKVDSTDGFGSFLEGPLQFREIATNRFNQITLSSGTLTNDIAFTFPFFETTLERNLAFPTNYSGGMVFTDGDIFSSVADYLEWVLSIDDMNDADGDGIPNLTDDLGLPAPRAPWLSITRGATNVLLTLSGDVGHTHIIEEKSDTLSGGWSLALSLMLTNDPQVISLPLPGPGVKTRVWRATAE